MVDLLMVIQHNKDHNYYARMCLLIIFKRQQMRIFALNIACLNMKKYPQQHFYSLI